MNIKTKERLIASLRDSKEYRDAFVSEHIDTGLPFQIKALRDQRKWSQEELGKRAGMKQETISRLEDPNYARFTLRTLKKLASGFDVALMVIFVPFSRLFDWESNLSPEALQAVSFEEDKFSLEKPIEREYEKEKIIEETINVSASFQVYSAGLTYEPKRLGAPAGANANAFIPEQVSQQSGLIKIMRSANETSFYKPRPGNLAWSDNRFQS
jgi:transcriptional regulator with XRE-family HTH domain